MEQDLVLNPVAQLLQQKKRQFTAKTIPNPRPSFLGYSVSYNLDFLTPSNPINPSMPCLQDLGDLAELADTPLGYLTWFCYYKEYSKSDHYRRFEIPKRNGSMRRIASPKKDLVKIQRAIKNSILDYAIPSNAACAYRAGKSITDCARPHQATSMVLRLDINDFFSNIGFGAVRIIFERLGYNPGVSTCLALLCTDADRKRVRIYVDLLGRPLESSENKGKERLRVRYQASSRLHLPQGACTSPALSNLFLSSFDDILTDILGAKGWSYTRYSDDLFFSPRDDRVDINADKQVIQRLVKQRLRNLQLELNTEKTRALPNHRCQKITGLVVNKSSNPGRSWRRQFRSAIHWCEKYSLAAYMGSYILGSLSFLRMTDPLKAQAISEKHPWIAELPKNQMTHYTRCHADLIGRFRIYDDIDLGARIRFDCLQLPDKPYYLDYICNTLEGSQLLKARRKVPTEPWYMDCAQYISESLAKVPSDRVSPELPKNSRIYWALVQRCLDSGRLNQFLVSPSSERLQRLHDRFSGQNKITMILAPNDAVKHYWSTDVKAHEYHDFYWDGVQLKKHVRRRSKREKRVVNKFFSVDEDIADSLWWDDGEFNSFWEWWEFWNGS